MLPGQRGDRGGAGQRAQDTVALERQQGVREIESLGEVEKPSGVQGGSALAS